ALFKNAIADEYVSTWKPLARRNREMACKNDGSSSTIWTVGLIMAAYPTQAASLVGHPPRDASPSLRRQELSPMRSVARSAVSSLRKTDPAPAVTRARARDLGACREGDAVLDQCYQRPLPGDELIDLYSGSGRLPTSAGRMVEPASRHRAVAAGPSRWFSAPARTPRPSLSSHDRPAA